MQSELELLKWAAGVPAQVPRALDLDTDLLLAALWQHKLTGRLLSRIEAVQPERWPPQLTEALRRQLRDVRANVEVRMELLREIGAAVVTTGEPPLLVVKGITSVVLTGDDSFARRSNDIDLLWDDPERLRRRLLDLGYAPADDHCRGHEYAALYKRGVKADLHGYFPVETSTRAPGAPSEGVVHTTRFAETAIGYDELSTGARESGIPGIKVPGYEAAALIAISHCYREYAHQPFPLPAGTVRIGELLEIDTLTQHRLFEPKRFRELADRYHAWQSIAFVDHMLTEGLGLRPIQARAADGAQPRFPYDLWLDGFVIHDHSVDPGAYFLRPEGLRLAGLVTRLGGEQRIGQVTYATAPGLAGRMPAMRYVQGDGVAATLSTRLDGQGLAIAAALTEPATGLSVRLMVNSGDVLHEVAWDRAAGAPNVSWQRNNSAGRQWRHPIAVRGSDSGTPTLTVRFPAEALDLPGPSGDWPLLVGVRAGDDNGTLVPLTIRP